jgi:hypothetical protein
MALLFKIAAQYRQAPKCRAILSSQMQLGEFHSDPSSFTPIIQHDPGGPSGKTVRPPHLRSTP